MATNKQNISLKSLLEEIIKKNEKTVNQTVFDNLRDIDESRTCGATLIQIAEAVSKVTGKQVSAQAISGALRVAKRRLDANPQRATHEGTAIPHHPVAASDPVVVSSPPRINIQPVPGIQPNVFDMETGDQTTFDYAAFADRTRCADHHGTTDNQTGDV